MENKSERDQYGAALGGNVEVPVTLPIQPFIRSRIDEIEALTQLIEMPSTKILLAKQFPKHLRRRAMSQNPKRIPKRLRNEFISAREKSGVRDVPLKRPRRKYRRRPSNLLDDYNRRQRENVWLETHIWHAKRFHMIEKWGYKLPYHPNDKSYRACYRASSKHCLIQDVSYYICIELKGEKSELIFGLNKHASAECGLTFSSSFIQSGCHESSILFYSANRYPKGAIGEITYFWQPASEDAKTRTLWLWSHPAFYNQVLNELIQTFLLELEEPMLVDDEESSPSQLKNVEKTKLLMRNVPFLKTSKFSSRQNSVKMVLLKDSLNRFRLTGPLSQTLITHAFSPIDLSKRKIDDSLTNYYKNGNQNSCDSQFKFWQEMKNVSSPGQLQGHLIFSSVIIDPRFTLPTHRKKAEPSIEDYKSQFLISTDQLLSWSPIWISDVRNEITSKKLSTHQLNEIRSDKLVPGLELESKDVNRNDMPAVPILLIQQPGEENDLKPLGYGCGWEIIVPSGYGMPVWLALSLHGGRAGGLKESNSVLRERGKPSFPPDTLAGKVEEEQKRKEDTDRYFSLPPAKRHNYIKLGIPTPFHSPWKTLINDWVGSELFYVLRNTLKLGKLKSKEKDINTIMPLLNSDKEALVSVMITVRSRGTLERNASICIPSIEDYQHLAEQKTFSGPVEPQHSDLFYTERKTARSQHKSLLKRLSRKRKKDRQNKENTISHSSELLVEKHKKTMQDFWLPECVRIKDYSSRTVMGFVSDGDFVFTNGKAGGIGYVSLEALIYLLKRMSDLNLKKYLILVRNTNSNQYRFAELNIIL